MNFAFSDEQEELRTAVRRFLAEKSPETEVRRLMDTTEGYDPAVWSQMADQLGLQSLTIPEEFGGSGFTYVELLVVLEEMGAALLCAPVLLVGGAGAPTRCSPRATTRPRRPTCPASPRARRSPRWPSPRTTASGTSAGSSWPATKKGDGWVLDGHKMFVIDGHVADLIVVAARTAAGVSLFAVEGDAAGLTRTPLPTMDQTRKQARLEFASTPGRADRHRRRSRARALQDPRPRRRGAGRRAGGRGPARARRLGRVRQDPDPVRPAHRQLPGHQAQVRRHAARGRVGQVGRLLRRLGRRRGLRRAARWWPAWPSRTARRPTSTPRRRTSRSTAASASPGSTRPTSTSSGPSPPSCSSAIPAYHRELLAQRIGI